MPLVVRDGNNANQTLPNAGENVRCYRIVDSTITASMTSATDIYQFVGATGTVARLRRLRFFNSANVAAGAFAANSTLFKILRRSAAGTTGTWTQLNTSTTYAKMSSATAAIASAITVNVAGTTAFTVGATAGTLDFKILTTPLASKVDALNQTVPEIEFVFGAHGAYPVDIVGTADYVVVNVGAVTPVATVNAVLEWEEATI